jgi:hypothetical protein
VVEEKRQCPNCDNTADGVVKDAEDADRESIDGGEIERIDATHSSYSCSVSYLRHLNNADSHNALQKKVTMHLWKKKKNDEAVRKIAMYAPLLL